MAILDEYVRTEKEKALFQAEKLVASVAIHLAKIMGNLSVSSKELSKKSGIKEKTIKHILLADRNVSLKVLTKLFCALNCNVTLCIKQKE